MESRRHLSPEEFAQVMGISLKTVRRRLKAGKLPADQSGGPGTLWRIDYDVFLQRMSNAAEEVSQPQSAAPATNVPDAKIPGPRPKWMQQQVNSDNKRGHGSQTKTKRETS